MTSHRHRRVVTALVLALTAAITVSGCTALTTALGGAGCHTVTIPVTLPVAASLTSPAPHRAAIPLVTTPNAVTPNAVTRRAAQASAHLSAWYCQPRGATPTTLLIAAHGGIHNHTYWAWPIEQGYYNATDKALAAGYAVLAVDRLGDGNSTRPPSIQDTPAAQVFTLHQVIQAARTGPLGQSYPHVLYLGHGLGSDYGVALAAAHPADLDALLLTGFSTHKPTTANAESHSQLVPARSLARFADLDTGYVTGKPRSRTAHRPGGPAGPPAGEDPVMLSWDQGTEDVVATTELTTRPADLTAALAALPHIPVLVMDGTSDERACGPDAGDCSTTRGWYRAEAAQFPVPACLAGQLEPGGHDLQLGYTAATTDAAMLSWATAILPPRASAAHCTVHGPITTPGIPLG
jgi:pimeloyl-ACP methyl ester carboxylesterase